MTELPHGWVDAGEVADLPEGGCSTTPDGRVLLVRAGDEVRAFENRCLHQDTPLHDGHISNGVLICPLHFWRYELHDGRLVGGAARLQRVPIEVRDGRIAVVPPPPPPSSVGQLMRQHAKTWSRDDPPVQRAGRTASDRDAR